MAAIESQSNSELMVKSGVDLVTETDKAAEKAIIDELRAAHPVCVKPRILLEVGITLCSNILPHFPPALQ